MEEGWTEVTAAWKGELTFEGRNAAGGIVWMGPYRDQAGIGPMQLLLVAVAGCTGEDIVSILQKKRHKLDDMQIKVRGKRAVDYPRIWTEIQITYLLWGENLPLKDVEQAIQLSEEKYCSVGIMLRSSTQLTSTYRIFKPGENAS
jgi:putative redox protein